MTIDKKQHRHSDDEFVDRVGQRLRDSVDELDATTLSRLNRARQVALEEMDKSASGRRWGNSWVAAGAAAAVAVIAVALWQGQIPDPESGSVPMVADEVVDIELLLDDGDLEMYAELEFFVWLPEDELENIG